MFRLVATVKRGGASDLDEVGVPYATVEDAREAARALGRRELITSIMIIDDAVPPTFVEWAVYKIVSAASSFGSSSSAWSRFDTGGCADRSGFTSSVAYPRGGARLHPFW